MTVDYVSPPKSYSNGGPYSLDKIDLPDAHDVNGREFPVAYQVNLHGEKFNKDQVEELLASISKDGTFTRLLENHGAVVLRDTVESSDSSKASELADRFRVVEENRGLVEFPQNGTKVLRAKKGHNLYVANASTPADVRITQHNEYSRFKRWPATIDFTVPEYTATGGETPLVHGAELFNKVQAELPDFLKKLSKLGLKFDRETWPLVSESEDGFVWNHEVTFGRYIEPGDDLATQKAKAERVAKEYISDQVEWGPDDELVITSHTKAVKKFKDEPLLFSSLAVFTDETRKDLDQVSKVRFGNGERFDKETIDKYNEIVKNTEYNHNWKSGDLVFVHNWQVSHGKLPYKDGIRTIHVGMWDEKSPEKSNLFVDYEL